LSYFIDVQGTLIDDEKREPIVGSIEFIDKLNAKQIPYVVVTNNTKKRSDDFYEYLVNLGFKIPKENYLVPFMVLNNILHVKDIYSFGPKEFVDVTKSLGYNNNIINPKAILIASSKDFNSDDYALMIEHIINGAKLIGMHATSIYAKDGKKFPGVGAILEMLSYATGSKYNVVGKPSQAFYEEALRILNLQKSGYNFSDVVMVSDDAVGDLCGIKKLGSKSILVLSGKCQNESEVLHVKEFLDVIVKDISYIEVANE
jgi:NagD protein